MPELMTHVRTALVCLLIAASAPAAEVPQPAEVPCNCLSADKEAQLIRALQKDQKLWGRNSTEVVWRHLQLADFYARRNERRKSDEEVRIAVDINRALKGTKSQKFKPDILIRQAKNRMVDQDYARAESLAREAVSAAHGNTKLSDAHSLLGWALAEQKKFSEAIANYETAIGLRKSNRDEQSVLQLQQLASLYQKTGKQDKAESLFERAIAEMSKLKGDRHPLTVFCRELLAANLMLQRKFDDAAKVLSKVLADRSAVLGADNPQLAGTLFQYASVLEMQGKPREAAAVRERAMNFSRKLTKK